MLTWAVVIAPPGRQPPPVASAVLDDPRSSLLAFPAERHHTWSSADGRVRAAGWSAGDAHLGVRSRWEARPGSVTAFSGHVWVDAAPWAADRSWAAQLADRYASRDIGDDVENLDGVFTLLHLRDDGSGWVTADPLGIGMVYRAERDGLVVLGNRAALVAELVTPEGRRPGRDVDAMAMLAGTGTLQGDRSGFADVRVIPQAAVVRLRADRAPTIETWSDLPWWLPVDVEDLDDVIDGAIDRMVARVRAVADLPVRSLGCELTGGKDSRVVLALLVAAGVAPNVRFMTWGSPTLPDVQVATALAERFDLTLVNGAKVVVKGSGRSGAPGLPPTTRWLARDLDYREKLRHHVWTTSAGLSVWDHRPVSWPPSPNLTLSGLFGECLRTNYSRTHRLSTPALLQWGLDDGILGLDAAGLLTGDAAEQVRTTTTETILGLVPPSGDVRDGLDGYYQRGRARRWGGMRQELDARNRMFPLYDLAAIRAGFAIGSEDRRNEALVLRIIERCAAELARVPFDHGGWPAELLDGLLDGDAYPGAPRRPVAVPSDAELAAAGGRRRRRPRWKLRRMVGGRNPQRRPESVSEAARMSDMAHRREVLRSFLDLPRHHATWDLFDRRRTLAALDVIEDLPKRGRGQVHDAVTVAMWLDGQEAPAGDLFEPNPNWRPSPDDPER